MPKLKDTIDSALGMVEPKAKNPPTAKTPTKDHIAQVLGRHKDLPTELVEKFYKCSNKTQVKQLLREHLQRLPA